MFSFLSHWLIEAAFEPLTAHAQGLGLSNVVTSVGLGLATSFTGAGFSGGIPGIAGGVVAAIWTVILPTGIFLVVRAGMSLIVSEDEGKLSTAKRTISSTLIGIILAYISQALVVGFYGNGTTGGIVGGGEATLQTTIYGLVNWFTVAMAALGALMIIVSVIRAIGSFGKEEELTNVRQTIFGTASGILMISLLPAIKLTLGIRDLSPLGALGGAAVEATPIIQEIGGIVSNLLVFLALIAVAIVIYAGVRMIVNFGNEEEFTKSRSLIIRAIIGMVVIFISYTAVILILSIGSGGTVA